MKLCRSTWQSPVCHVLGATARFLSSKISTLCASSIEPPILLSEDTHWRRGISWGDVTGQQPRSSRAPTGDGLSVPNRYHGANWPLSKAVPSAANAPHLPSINSSSNCTVMYLLSLSTLLLSAVLAHPASFPASEDDSQTWTVTRLDYHYMTEWPGFGPPHTQWPDDRVFMSEISFGVQIPDVQAPGGTWNVTCEGQWKHSVLPDSDFECFAEQGPREDVVFWVGPCKQMQSTQFLAFREPCR